MSFKNTIFPLYSSSLSNSCCCNRDYRLVLDANSIYSLYNQYRQCISQLSLYFIGLTIYIEVLLLYFPVCPSSLFFNRPLYCSAFRENTSFLILVSHSEHVEMFRYLIEEVRFSLSACQLIWYFYNLDKICSYYYLLYFVRATKN